MAGYPFNKKQLKNAARIYAERRNDALEESLDQEPVQFSPEFQNEIASMISASDAAIKKRNHIRSRVAAAIVALIILITGFFSFNTTARAAFVNWIKDFYKEYIVYHLFGEETSDDFPELIPGWIPDDIKKIDSSVDEICRIYQYKTPDQSSSFDLSVEKADSGSSLYIWDANDDRQHFTRIIGDYEVDCYVSADDISDYVWHDAEGKFFFTISSDLPHEINVKIIENLKVK